MNTIANSGRENAPALLLTAESYSRALVIAQLLDGEGIPSILRNARRARKRFDIRRLLQATLGLHQGPCDVLVPPSSLARAARIVEAARHAGAELERLAALDSDEAFELESGEGSREEKEQGEDPFLTNLEK